MNPTIDFTPVLAVEQVTTLSPESIIMLLFGCAVLYGGFFWCTSIAWKNRHKHQGDDEEEMEEESTPASWDQ